MLDKIWRALTGAGDAPRGAANDELREMLFADEFLARRIAEREDPDAGVATPQSMLAAAARTAASGDRAGAERALRELLLEPQMESRMRLLAWHMLRALGVRPDPADERAVEGVVLEVMLPQGLDVLAAYRDHTARFLSHGGSAIVWEAPTSEMDRHIDALLLAGEEIARRTGPHLAARPGKPPRGAARINVLTRGGLHYGEGPLDALIADALAGPAIHAGTALMQALTSKAQRTS